MVVTWPNTVLVKLFPDISRSCKLLSLQSQTQGRIHAPSCSHLERSSRSKMGRLPMTPGTDPLNLLFRRSICVRAVIWPSTDKDAVFVNQLPPRSRMSTLVRFWKLAGTPPVN